MLHGTASVEREKARRVERQALKLTVRNRVGVPHYGVGQARHPRLFHQTDVCRIGEVLLVVQRVAEMVGRVVYGIVESGKDGGGRFRVYLSLFCGL